MKRIQTVDFHQQVQYQGIRVVPYCAGHILGAAMFLIKIGHITVLYTGDYSCQQDRYILPAQIPNDIKIDILIIQSTYGTREHQPRHLRQRNFIAKIQEIVKGGGKCLLPVFAVGRAEQLLLMLQQNWAMYQEQLFHIKIYYTCALIHKCKQVYKAYISMLSKNIQQKFYKQQQDPFHFRYVHWLQSNNLLKADSNDPLVIMCSPGMLQSGQSRQLLQKWCHDPKNGVILTGYCVEGSLADNLRKGTKIRKLNGEQTEVKMDVSTISFSAHADCIQTTNFIKQMQPEYVVLVHGSQKNAKALQKHLLKQFAGCLIAISDIVAPENIVSCRFRLKKKKRCKIVGQLMNKVLNQIQEEKEQEQDKNQSEKQTQMQRAKVKIEGILINRGQNQHSILIHQKEKQSILSQQKQLYFFIISKIFQKVYVNYGGTIQLACFLSNHIFSKGNIISKEKKILEIQKDFFVQIDQSKSIAIFNWKSSYKLDVMADQFAFLLSQIPTLHYDIFHPQYFSSQKNLYTLIKQSWPQSILIEQNEQNIIQIRDKNNMIGKVDLKTWQVEGSGWLQMRVKGLIETVHR